MKKGFKQMLAEANAAIHTIDVQEALARHNAGGSVFVDVRESQEWNQGHVAGAVSVPRGLLEFMADPESPMHKPELSGNKPLILYCASGGRSALASKTLKDMGYENVCHIAGGIQAWAAAGGTVEG